MQLSRSYTRFSLKSIKYEYQHCISNTNSSISIDISIFWGARLKKAPGEVCTWVRFQKILDFPFFDQRQKSNTQASWNSKMTQKGSALLLQYLVL